MYKIDPVREQLIRLLPKVELHLHIEGTLEPEMMMSLAAKHGIKLPYGSVEDIRAAYHFSDQQSFFKLYYAGCDVLRDREDFYALAMAYFTRARADNVAHAELFLDPQSHLSRGIAMEIVIGGLRDAMADARERYGITSALIPCFLRDRSEEDAFATLEALLPFLGDLIGIGLDSAEQGNPPSKFARVFAKARDLGLHPVAHAGEEGPPAYIWEALDVLKAERIGHGVHCVEDDALVERLVREQIPLTVCPISNLRTHVVRDLRDLPFALLLRRGVAVTINSDDPGYFGAYIADNYRATAAALGLTREEIITVTETAARASFLPAPAKTALLGRIRQAAARA